MIAGVVKGFGFTIDYALNGISYANLTLLSATLPDDGSTAKNDDNDGIIDASDPCNRNRVRQILQST